MKHRFLFHLFITALVTAMVVGGLTTAWLTSRDFPSSTSMVTGTVGLEIVKAELLGDYEETEMHLWAPGESLDFNWILGNTGSKRAFFRARVEEYYRPGHTAWAEGARFTERGQWGMYFEYSPGKTEQSPYTTALKASQHIDVGTVDVWNDSEFLYINVVADPDWSISKLHLSVADDFELSPTTGGRGNFGNPIPGQFPFKDEFTELVESHQFKLPLQAFYPAGVLNGEDYSWNGQDKLYIALHADMYAGEEEAFDLVHWALTEDCPFSWLEGEDGYWYYCQPARAWDTVELCLTGTLNEDALDEDDPAGLYRVELSAESIQASNQALAETWPDAPCNNKDND